MKTNNFNVLNGIIMKYQNQKLLIVYPIIVKAMFDKMKQFCKNGICISVALRW